MKINKEDSTSYSKIIDTKKLLGDLSFSYFLLESEEKALNDLEKSIKELEELVEKLEKYK